MSNSTSSILQYAQISTPNSKSDARNDDDSSSQSSLLDFGSRAGSKTPRRFRPDVNSTIDQIRVVRLEESEDDGDRDQQEIRSATSERPRPGPRIFVWGTRICVTDVQQQFRKFLCEFCETALDEDEMQMYIRSGDAIDRTLPFYLQLLQEISITQQPHLNVNLQHVKTFNEAFYRQVVCYPADIIPYLDFVANSLFEERYPDQRLPFQVQVRPFNADRTRNMRDLNPEDIDQLITIHGMIIRTSPLIPEMRQGYFECSICQNSLEVEVDRGRIEEPTLCQNCNTNHCFHLVHNRCFFMDKQIIKLQESPDDMPAGQTPHAVSAYAHGDLVDEVQPGDRVTVTGIYRAIPLRINPRQRTVKAVYKTYIDVLHFRKTDVHRLHSVDDGTELSNERINQIKELANKSDVYERLAHALAPSIYEHEDIKKGILCLLFGGTKKDFTNSGKSHFRSEINVLLCGDPGTSKSQLLQYVHNLVPRGQYTSGKGSSAVGLTAYVTRDPETKYFVLQTGALVLSDNGVCCIDEFDKMSDSTRSVLHEVMEQQTLSIAKAGIICQLNARTSILAAANPVDSQWNKNKTIIENVQLPHTLLSRFDLIFLMVDPQDEYYDRRLATHLVSLYYKGQDDEDSSIDVDMSLLRDYVAYAKACCHPKLTEAAGQNLVEKYVRMRQVGSGRGQVSAYPRQLESLIRLAEAHAKVRLSPTVEESDVEEAYRLHREALKQSAVDPLTGKVDVNILAAGMSSTTRKHMMELADVLKRTLAAKPFGTWYGLRKLLADVRDNSDRLVTRELFEDAVNELAKNDVIMRGRDGQIRLQRAITTADAAMIDEVNTNDIAD